MPFFQRPISSNIHWSETSHRVTFLCLLYSPLYRYNLKLIFYSILHHPELFFFLEEQDEIFFLFLISTCSPETFIPVALVDLSDYNLKSFIPQCPLCCLGLPSEWTAQCFRTAHPQAGYGNLLLQSDHTSSGLMQDLSLEKERDIPVLKCSCS